MAGPGALDGERAQGAARVDLDEPLGRRADEHRAARAQERAVVGGAERTQRQVHADGVDVPRHGRAVREAELVRVAAADGLLAGADEVEVGRVVVPPDRGRGAVVLRGARDGTGVGRVRAVQLLLDGERPGIPRSCDGPDLARGVVEGEEAVDAERGGRDGARGVRWRARRGVVERDGLCPGVVRDPADEPQPEGEVVRQRFGTGRGGPGGRRRGQQLRQPREQAPRPRRHGLGGRGEVAPPLPRRVIEPGDVAGGLRGEERQEHVLRVVPAAQPAADDLRGGARVALVHARPPGVLSAPGGRLASRV